MKTYIFRRLFIVLLSIALLNNITLSTSATDSNEYESESGEDVSPDDSLMYAQGGTWIQAVDGRWWYRHADGTYTTSDWEYINGKWYYFDADGWMVTGWLQLGNTWYYLLPSSGEMVTGWKYIGNKRYYFNSNGAMQTGWLELGVTWYYLESDGAMATGWKFINNYWYYFTSAGVMYTGWLELNNKYYYLDDNGHMLTGWQYLTYGNAYEGNAYYHYFNSSGEFITDSDTRGCNHGINTFLDHINLKGTTLKYFINPSCSFISEITSACASWSSAVSLTRIYSTIPSADILFFSVGSDNFYGHTYHYDSNDHLVSPVDSNWYYCRIALNSQNDTPAATTAHEIGHAFGLSHRISKTDSIMQYCHDHRTVSVPQPCDFAVISHLY